MSTRTRAFNAVFCLGVAALLSLPVAPARAGEATPRVYGLEIGNWGHVWWKWAALFKKGTNPLMQSGPVDCAAHQVGKVWFLAGTFSGPETTRACSIKRGKALFFPLYNGLFWKPEDCSDEPSCRRVVGAFIDTLTSWNCEIDGQPCVWTTQIVRAQSDPRPFYIPKNSEFANFASPGLRRLTLSDGYWVMLDPLPPGQHTLHFKATAPNDFLVDVTYQLTVE